MPDTKRVQILKLAKRSGVLRPRDLERAGISGEYLNRLHSEGVLSRPSRGLYVLAEREVSEHQSLIEACKRVPHGVVCLLSALRFHGLTTQTPFEVWLAIGEKARLPKVDSPTLRVVRFGVASLVFGVKAHKIGRVAVPVTTPAKTVADCFKYRNKIGLDVALEALRDCLRKRLATMDAIWEAARVCRMTNVMRPYLEAIAS